MHTELPDIFISPADQKHLKKVLADAYNRKERVAPFLGAELRRARLHGPAQTPPGIVGVGSRVSYRLDWGPASSYRQLVSPEDFTNAAEQISLLSPIGVALLGLKAGDRMKVFTPGTGFQTISVVDVR